MTHQLRFYPRRSRLACSGVTVLAQQPPAGQPAGRAGGPPGGRAGGAPPPPSGIPREPLGDGPWNYAVAEGVKFRLSVVTKGLQNPWDLEFLPDGSMLVTERPGRLRIVRNGVLEPTAVTGLPPIGAQRLGGLQDIALHPKFAENKLLYFTYSKTDGKGMIMSALGRGRVSTGSRADERAGADRRGAVVERRRRCCLTPRVRSRRLRLLGHRIDARHARVAGAKQPARQSHASHGRRQAGAGKSICWQSRDTGPRSIRWAIGTSSG